MKIQVFVRLKHGVLDVQGKAVENSIKRSGVEFVSDIRIGKLIELDVDAQNFAEAKEKITPLCNDLLANTIIENYEVREVA